MIKVKICGITRLEDAIDALKLGADAIGFVFAESKRKISIKDCEKIINKLPPFAYTVGVFMNNDILYINNILKKCYFSALQFHGDESEEFCKSFNKPVIKGFSISSENDILKIENYPNIKNILLDGANPGSKTGFDHNLLKKIDKNKKIILAGGLTPHNITDILENIRDIYAVDVSSGVETSPGIKNYELMQDFIFKVKKCSEKNF